MNGSRPGSVSRASHLETQSNAYATINKLPMVAGSSRRSLFNGSLGFTDHGHGGEMIPSPERDYATLEKSIRSPQDLLFLEYTVLQSINNKDLFHVDTVMTLTGLQG